MTLQERLEKAAEERRRAAGLPSRPKPSTTQAPSDDRTTVDLTDVAPVIDLRPVQAPSFSPSFTVAWQSDTCPDCGSGNPRLDMQDLAGGVDHYTCTACGHLFQVPR